MQDPWIKKRFHTNDEAPSNSKSEEHRCEECNSVCQNCNTAPEPPQDTSLDDIVDFLCGSKPLQGRWFGEKYEGIPVYWWRNYLRIAVKQSQAKLLQVIEDEAVELSTVKEEEPKLYRFAPIKAVPLEVIKKLKDNVINGGSL